MKIDSGEFRFQLDMLEQVLKKKDKTLFVRVYFSIEINIYTEIQF